MAHTGVLQVLDEARVPIDVIVGTSAGAIVGALYAGGMSGREIKKYSQSLSFRKWFARDTSGMGLFSTDGMRRIVETALGSDVNIEDLAKPFACVAVDLDSQQEVIFDSGPLADAVCASSAYPGLFAPVKIGNRVCFDGGVLNPVPFDVVRRYGADYVIAVDLGLQEPFFSALGEMRVKRGSFLGQWFEQVARNNVIRVVERSLGIMSMQLRDNKLHQSPPDLMITPRVHNVGMLDFDQGEACCAEGEVAARLVQPQLERLLQRAARSSRVGYRWQVWGRLMAWRQRLFRPNQVRDI